MKQPPQMPDLADQTLPDDEIDLFELWDTLVESKWLVIGAAAICFLLATALAFIMTPKYEAEVLFVSAEQEGGGGRMASLAGQFGGLADLAGINLGGSGGSKEANIAFLKSRGFIETFIKEKQLMPILYAKKWDEKANKWKVDDPEDIPTLWDASQFFEKKVLSVSQEKKTNLITLKVLWKDRQQAVDWANDLVRRANESLRLKAIGETDKSLSYLEQELKKTSVVEVQQAIYRVMESQVKTRMMANVQEQFAFKIIDPAALMGEKDYVKPKRLLMMVLGLLGGGMLGILLVFARKALRNRKEQQKCLARAAE